MNKVKKSSWMLAASCLLTGSLLCGCTNENDEPAPPAPDTPAQPSNPKDWGDETPFFLIDSVEDFTIEDKTADGFLYNTGCNCDFFVICHNMVVGAPGSKKNTNMGVPWVSFFITFNGEHLSPVENVERYNRMCLNMGAKPYSELNDSAVLGTLPFYRLRRNHTMETVARIEAFIDRDVLTGQLYPDGLKPTDFVRFLPTASKSYIEKNLNILQPDNNYPEGICYLPQTGNQIISGHRSCITWFDTRWESWISMPDEPGIYTVKIRITLTNGKTMEDSVKIRFMPEGTEYPQ